MSSLWSAVIQYMNKHNINTTGTDAVTNYVRRIVENKVLKHMEDPKNSCIIGGDFNAGWKTDECKKITERSHHKFRQWTEQLGLQNDLAAAHDNKSTHSEGETNLKHLMIISLQVTMLSLFKEVATNQPTKKKTRTTIRYE